MVNILLCNLMSNLSKQFDDNIVDNILDDICKYEINDNLIKFNNIYNCLFSFDYVRILCMHYILKNINLISKTQSITVEIHKTNIEKFTNLSNDQILSLCGIEDAFDRIVFWSYLAFNSVDKTIVTICDFNNIKQTYLTYCINDTEIPYNYCLCLDDPVELIVDNNDYDQDRIYNKTMYFFQNLLSGSYNSYKIYHLPSKSHNIHFKFTSLEI